MDDNSTYVSSEFRTLFENVIGSNPQIHEIIKEVKEESNIFLCKVLKFYPYSDKAYVKILNTNENIWCRLTHDILDSNMSIRGTNRGKVRTGKKTNATYIEPYDDIYGIVAKVRWNGTKDENCFISCVNLNNDNSLNDIIGDGEILLNSRNSYISITDERINISTPKLFINGLPSTSPNLDNYYDKTEVNVIKNNTDAIIESLSESSKHWETLTLDNYSTLYVNNVSQQCELRFVRSFSSATSYYDYSWGVGLIPSEYRPSSKVIGYFDQNGIIYVDETGKIGGKFFTSWADTPTQCIGTIHWHY